MSAEHLRPLFAFVVVAIVGGVVFGNLLRAQDVVDAIRDGASDVLAGTPLQHDPPYVVEDGKRLEVAEEPGPEVDPPAEAGSAPVVGVSEGATNPDAATSRRTPRAGNDAGTRSTGQASQRGDRGQHPGPAAGGRPGAPKAGATNPGDGPQNSPGRAGSGGPGGGHGQGHDKAKGHDRTGSHAKVSHAGASGRATHDRAGQGTAKGHHKAGHGKANGHDKKGHGKRHGHR